MTRLIERQLFAGAATLYLAAAAILTFAFHVTTIQALGLVANAAYVELGRDPHLAAIGFVASPLPSALLIPLLPLHVLWPALTDSGFLACIVSSFFMAGAVYQLYGLLREAAVAPVMRLIVTVLFAIHPLILYTAASGSGEATFLFFLLLATRHLARWLRDGDTIAATVAGMALAGAYLARYDAVVAGAGAVILVAAVSAVRSGQHRLATAVCDALIVGGPLLATVGFWAAAAWLVTGSALPQVFAPEGYLTQLDALRAHGAQAAAATASPGRTLTQILSLEPALPAAALLLPGLLRPGRRWGTASSVSVLGPLVAGIAIASMLGWAFPWLRLLIVVVPLVSVAIGLSRGAPRIASPFPTRGGREMVEWRWIAPLAAVLMLAAALPTSAVAMLSPRTGQEEQPALRAIFGRAETLTAASSSFLGARAAAAYLDAEHLQAGSVLLDSVTGFPVILASSAPRQFLITSDREFAFALERPESFGVRFVLVPAPTYMNSLGSLDAINRTYPDLFASAAASSGLVGEFRGPDNQVEWRLYRVAAIQPSA